MRRGLTFATIVSGGLLLAAGVSAQRPQPLHEQPAIAYAATPTTDRVGALAREITAGTRTLQRDPKTGYLRPLLDALAIAPESQMLVFSKTGVQRAFTSPHTPRALYFDQTVAIGYVPGAPRLEVAAQDPRQGVVFYTIDQTAAAPVIARQTGCLLCHVSNSTLQVPGLITRSNVVGDDGTIVPAEGHDVDDRTPHPDRWGGWFVTQDAASVPYAQRAHAGNLTTTVRGETSNQVLVDWMNSEPERRGYLSPLSDIVALLVFDHHAHAVNLLTRLGWEARVSGAAGRPASNVPRLVDELADYLLLVGEMPPAVALYPRPGLAEHLLVGIPKDHQGRSLAQLDLERRLFRYRCSPMIYSPAFDALPPAVKTAVYQRMLEILSGGDAARKYASLSVVDRRDALDILRDTKPDFPRPTETAR
ncbi:MAG TPA: hypothetical protein VEU08_07670 [Vicinamibacterales bacterium]|nr:hypothetical protein [Vicinamibacterales bacterium]